MKRILLGAVAAVALSTAAAQAADPVAMAYGNTVTQTLADGTKIVIYVNPDHTWERHIGAVTAKGTFEVKDDTHVCFTQTDPAVPDPAKATNCNEIKGDHKVGDTWTETGPGGAAMTMSITAGR
jgi:opacity protein-like surface antigen